MATFFAEARKIEVSRAMSKSIGKSKATVLRTESI
jgi:hypothetical protein